MSLRKEFVDECHNFMFEECFKGSWTDYEKNLYISDLFVINEGVMPESIMELLRNRNIQLNSTMLYFFSESFNNGKYFIVMYEELRELALIEETHFKRYVGRLFFYKFKDAINKSKSMNDLNDDAYKNFQKFILPFLKKYPYLTSIELIKYGRKFKNPGWIENFCLLFEEVKVLIDKECLELSINIPNKKLNYEI